MTAVTTFPWSLAGRTQQRLFKRHWVDCHCHSLRPEILGSIKRKVCIDWVTVRTVAVSQLPPEHGCLNSLENCYLQSSKAILCFQWCKSEWYKHFSWADNLNRIEAYHTSRVKLWRLLWRSVAYLTLVTVKQFKDVKRSISFYISLKLTNKEMFPDM